MAEKPKIPAAPKGTGPSGRALWADVLGHYELESHELCLLTEMARTVDQLDELYAIAEAEGPVVSGPHGTKVHPAIPAAKELRICLARVSAALRLPSGEEGASARRPQRRGPRGVHVVGA